MPSPLPAGGFRFDGNWECTGAITGRGPHKSLFTGTMILNGTWVELTEKDVEPSGYLGKYLLGYDPQQKHFVEFGASNYGAATYSSAEGWQGQVLTMTSPVSTPTKEAPAATRYIYSITGADAFTIDWQISKTTALEWITGDHLACKRQPSNH